MFILPIVCKEQPVSKQLNSLNAANRATAKAPAGNSGCCQSVAGEGAERPELCHGLYHNVQDEQRVCWRLGPCPGPVQLIHADTVSPAAELFARTGRGGGRRGQQRCRFVPAHANYGIPA